MIIDAHTHIGKLPNSLYGESYGKNLDLILNEAKEGGVDALIMIAGMEKEDGRNPTTQSLINLVSDHKNVYADMSGLVIGDELQTAYGEMMKKRIKELIEYTAPEFKLLYGTDWPLCHMKQYIEFANNLDLKKDDLEKLFSGNAKKIFKLG